MGKQNNRLLVLDANKRLPARLKADEAAALLGFAEHDVPVLMRAKLLKPLGKPSQNSTKYFHTQEVLQIAADRDWLDKATKAVANYWKQSKEDRETDRETKSASPEQE